MKNTLSIIKLATQSLIVTAFSITGISILTSGNVYAQTVNQNASTDTSWLWWLLPLAALGILFFVLRRSLQIQQDDDYQQRFGFGDDAPLAGVKGGKVERERHVEDLDEVDFDEEHDNTRAKADPWDRTKDDWNV